MLNMYAAFPCYSMETEIKSKLIENNYISFIFKNSPFRTLQSLINNFKLYKRKLYAVLTDYVQSCHRNEI
jgi:hypothetical protein